MPTDFNKITNRKNTNSLKYDFAPERGKPQDLLPLWVADMDFPTAPAITDKLIEVCRHGIFGYTETREEYFNVLKNWFSSHYDWEIQRKWLLKTPGVVYAISMAVRAFTEIGDAVLIQRPVYYPFSESIESNERLLINNPLVYENGAYHIDFKDFEDKILRHKVKLFILCNPHNPVGRVWTRDELLRMGDLCLKHKVLIVSDEIHADFVYGSHIHLPLANLKPEYESITITCTAPSKSFNLAGLQVSNILIPNQKLKYAFKNEIVKSGYSQLNTMGLYACQAAYEHGGEWLEELKEYLSGNLSFVIDFIKNELPQLKLIEPEGTYLIWIDFRELRLSDGKLEDLITKKGKLWLDDGLMFGPEGSGFQRMNIACPREILKQAMNQLKDAVRNEKA